MDYSLQQVCQDKALRKALLESKIYFSDHSGIFSDLDFIENSWRINMRTVFDTIAAQGGTEALDAILKADNTALTTDPKAANAGMVAVRGVEGYYIKTNTNPMGAFTSIVNALLDFDAQEVTFSDESSIDELTICYGDDVYSLEQAIKPAKSPFEAWLERQTAPTISIVTKNGQHCFYDDSKEKFVTLTDDKGAEMTAFFAYEPVKLTKGDTTVSVGYRYQMKAHGKWGFVNSNFTVVQAPQFPELWGFTETGDLYIVNSGTFSYYDFESQSIKITDIRIFFRDLNGCQTQSCYKAHVFGEEHQPDEEDYLLFKSGAGDFVLRMGTATYTIKWFDDILHVTEEGSTKCKYCVVRDDFRTLALPQMVSVVKHSWDLNLGDDTTFNRLLKRSPTEREVDNLTLYAAVCVVKQGRKYGLVKVDTSVQQILPCQFDDIRVLSSQFIKVKKGGLWGMYDECGDCRTPHAFTSIKNFECMDNVHLLNSMGLMGLYKDGEYILPCAYTKIESSRHFGDLLVEQYGKQGVYSMKEKRQIIPCDYESIEYDGTDFVVRKMDFVGEIRKDGTWRVHLHRED